VVLVLPPVELPVPGEVLLEPMSPLPPMLPVEDPEFGLLAELSEPLTGPEGDVALLSVADPGLFAFGLLALLSLLPEPLLGFIALLDPMPLLELPAVEPPVPALCAKAAGANAATDNAKPAPNK
jgi:hypothetical protein